MAFEAQDYEVRIWWSAEDSLYLAQCLEMPGVMAHGDTRATAAQSIQEAIELALFAYREDREEPPLPLHRPKAQAA